MLDYTRSLLAGAEALERWDYDGAKRCFTASLGQIKTKLTPERFRQMSFGLLANLEYNRGDYRSALEYLHQSLAEAEAPDVRATLYNLLQRCYKALGDDKESAYYLSRYVTLTDTLLRSGQAKALRDIEKQNSTELFNRRLSRVHSERRSLMIVLSVILTAFVGVVALGIRLWVQRGKLKLANEELYRQARAKTHPLIGGAQEIEGTASDNSTGEEPDLMDRLCEIMKSSPEVFRTDFTLDVLARLADAPSRKVSHAINSRFDMNFSTFLQKYRVEEACRRFDDRERYGHQTIEAISEGLGFKSRSNFVAVFKKFTGLTPSMYQKIASSHSRKPKT